MATRAMPMVGRLFRLRFTPCVSGVYERATDRIYVLFYDAAGQSAEAQWFTSYFY
jgi:hypothetical protein